MQKEITPGQEIQVKIESIGAKGDGIAKIEGFAIIIKEAKMNERLKVRINKVFPKYAFAEIIE